MSKKKLSKQISLGYDPMTGKRIRKRIYANGTQELRQRENDLRAEFANQCNPSGMTYDEYERKWWNANCSHLAPATQTSYEKMLKKMEPVRYMKMSQIIRTDLQQIIANDWSHPTTCEKLASLMGSIWRNAVFDGVVQKNIAERLKRPKKGKSVRRALTQKELDAIKIAKFTPDERLMVDILLQFGLRPGEAYALDMRSFDRKTRMLTINKALTHKDNLPIIKTTKTGVTRRLPIPDSFWNKLPSKRMYLFTNSEGTLLKRNEMVNMTLHIVLKINYAMGGTYYIRATNLSLYTFRHNKASLLYYMPGVSMKKKAEYMGHSETMFLKTYSHLIEEKEDIELLRQEVV